MSFLSPKTGFLSPKIVIYVTKNIIYVTKNVISFTKNVISFTKNVISYFRNGISVTKIVISVPRNVISVIKNVLRDWFQFNFCYQRKLKLSIWNFFYRYMYSCNLPYSWLMELEIWMHWIWTCNRIHAYNISNKNGVHAYNISIRKEHQKSERILWKYSFRFYLLYFMLDMHIAILSKYVLFTGGHFEAYDTLYEIVVFALFHAWHAGRNIVQVFFIHGGHFEASRLLMTTCMRLFYRHNWWIWFFYINMIFWYFLRNKIFQYFLRKKIFQYFSQNKIFSCTFITRFSSMLTLEIILSNNYIY